MDLRSESFISVLVSVIGDYKVLNNFLKVYGGEYQIVSNLNKVPIYSSNFCVYSGSGNTHYLSHSKKGMYLLLSGEDIGVSENIVNNFIRIDNIGK